MATGLKGFATGGFLRKGPPGLHFESSGGRLGTILVSLGVAWAPFWRFWAPPGIHFGGPGGPLGFILGALGLLGRLWGSLGAPLAAEEAQSQIFPLFSLPFWGHFGSILEVKIDKKSDMFFDRFFN